VKDVPLAGGRQVDLMATFARSPLVHRWTSSPSTSCLAYLPQRMVATDYLTKWLEAVPLCDAEAHTCMRALYSAFFSRFGLPRQLHSDQGSNFESKLVAELCSIAGINKTRTTPFQPRSDGQTERANRTILQMLRASIDAQPESWPDRLPTLLAAYHMTPHSVTGISPNMAMMGREVLLPASLMV